MVETSEDGLRRQYPQFDRYMRRQNFKLWLDVCGFAIMLVVLSFVAGGIFGLLLFGLRQI